MPTNGSQVKFFYAASTTALPATKNADTIYFDAQAKAIYVGPQVIAADNAAQDLSGFVTTTSLANTLNSYVTKANSVVSDELKVENSSNGVQSIMSQTTNGFIFSVYDEDLSTTPQVAVLSGLATPTANTDAANKQYVDAQVASAGATWTVN